MHRGSAAASGGSFDKIRPGFLGQQAGDGLFSSSVSRTASMMTLTMAPPACATLTTPRMSFATDSRSRAFSAPMLMTMSDLIGTMAQGILSLEGFHSEAVAPSGKADHRADLHRRALEQLGAQFRPGGVDTHRGKAVLAGFVSNNWAIWSCVASGLSRVVVDIPGQVNIAGDHAQGGGKPVPPATDDVPGPVKAGVSRKACRRSQPCTGRLQAQSCFFLAFQHAANTSSGD